MRSFAGVEKVDEVEAPAAGATTDRDHGLKTSLLSTHDIEELKLPSAVVLELAS
jgi:hypothetical protein